MQTMLPMRTALQPVFDGDPFQTFPKDIDGLLNRFSVDGVSERLTRATAPRLDLSETNDALEIHLDMPGMNADEIDIQLMGNTVCIAGEHKEKEEDGRKKFHRVERHRGKFSRSIVLPCAVQQDKIQATYRNGVLTLTLPKTEVTKTRRIPVKG